MLRNVLVAVGLVQLLAPERFVRVAEGLALKNPDECTHRSWVVPVARVEGLCCLGLAWRGDPSYSGFRRFLGLVGLAAFLYPRLFVDRAAGVAYTNPERCEWRPWCYPLARLVGLLYLFVALDDLGNTDRRGGRS